MLFEELIKREKEGNPLRIGMCGAGWMGSGFVTQVTHVPGMQVVALADPDPHKARGLFIDAGFSGELIVVTDNQGEAEDAVRAGRLVVTTDYTLCTKIDAVDIVTDVTPSPASGAEIAYAGIQHGKDVVLVNIEADVTVGWVLKNLAEKNNVLYSVSSGDEPGCLMELWDFVNTLGYEPMVIGKGKNNPLQHDATPDTVAESAERDGKDPFQVASYVDGTKTMFEMACAANATGCKPMKRGMVGPEADMATVSDIFALKEDGGVTTASRSVDFVQGPSMAGGVFATVRIEDRRIQSDLKYLKVGEGPYFTFFRPYHLWFLEAPLSFARAHLYRQKTLVPLDEPVAEVMTIAKRDLKVGEKLDEFGGYTFFGMIDKAGEARRQDALPVGLAPGSKMREPVSKGNIVTWNDVELDESSILVKLRRMQDELRHRDGAQ
jgi:predicted homoserine dehydrogenase-like protein